MVRLSILLVLFLFHNCLSLFTSSDDLVILNSGNWKENVENSDSIWFVVFYAPWCGACQSASPNIKEFAKTVKGVIKVGAVEIDQNRDLTSRYPVSGVPTIYIFGRDKSKPVKYEGPMSTSDLLSRSTTEVQNLFDTRQGKSSRSSGSSSRGRGPIELTDANFDEKVMASKEMWLVGFFAPWCGHCKALEPAWKEAAAELHGKMNLGSIDATVHKTLASRYQIQGFPTIKFFKAGPKGEPEEYTGGRSKQDIVNWAMEKLKSALPPPEVKEAISNNVVMDSCKDKQLCIMSVLPVLLDCQSSCRNDYIKMLKMTAAEFKEHNWGWVWFEAVSQPDVEKALDIGGFGYPAMVAVNERKKKFALLRGSFSATGIHEFLRDLSLGRGGGLRELKNMPEFAKISAWDGKDAPMIQEEEIDLSDLGIKTEL